MRRIGSASHKSCGGRVEDLDGPTPRGHETRLRSLCVNVPCVLTLELAGLLFGCGDGPVCPVNGGDLVWCPAARLDGFAPAAHLQGAAIFYRLIIGRKANMSGIDQKQVFQNYQLVSRIGGEEGSSSLKPLFGSKPASRYVRRFNKRRSQYLWISS